jgi:hypothetical protein
VNYLGAIDSELGIGEGGRRQGSPELEECGWASEERMAV